MTNERQVAMRYIYSVLKTKISDVYLHQMNNKIDIMAKTARVSGPDNIVSPRSWSSLVIDTGSDFTAISSNHEVQVLDISDESQIVNLASGWISKLPHISA